MSGSCSRLSTFLIAALLTVLPGCASKGPSISGMKVGLHIDAVLELVVEYPLQWRKDRRLDYGRNEGEIRWSHPNQDGTLLLISSRFRQYQDDEQQLQKELGKYPGLANRPRLQVELPAGQAWHVSEQATQQQVELYLFLKPHRVYEIALKRSSEDSADYENLMEKIVQSFHTLTE
jgi:hypothetical protein